VARVTLSFPDDRSASCDDDYYYYYSSGTHRRDAVKILYERPDLRDVYDRCGFGVVRSTMRRIIIVLDYRGRNTDFRLTGSYFWWDIYVFYGIFANGTRYYFGIGMYACVCVCGCVCVWVCVCV